MSRKTLSWVAKIGYPGMKPFEFGNLETLEFDPAYVRAQFNSFIDKHMPPGFELLGFRRGRLVFEEQK